MVMAFLCGVHFWWPKMTGRMYNEAIGKIGVLLIYAGFNLTFLPQFVLGYLGMPRRYSTYPEEFQPLNIMSSAGASVLGLGFGLTIVMLLWSLFKGEKASANPYKAKGLEWTDVGSPPIAHNYVDIPVVMEEAYAYGPDHHHKAESDLEPSETVKETDVV
jgi:cytochrome c oxidase subunit 1